MRIINSKTFLSSSANIFLVSVLALGGLALLVGRVEAQTDRLVANGSFEEQGDKKQVAAEWQPFGQGYRRVRRAHTGQWGIKLRNSGFVQQSGASQRIDLQQDMVKPVQITGYVRGKRIKMKPGSWFGASLYAEIHMRDGSVAYWNSVPNVGSFGWRRVGFNTGTLTAVDQPIDHIFVVPILADARGKVWFDDIAVREYEPAGAAVTLMFDDGELSTYSEAWPLMKGHNFKGAAAIITGEVGEEGFMSWDQLRELQAERWEIVSHGVTHSDLTTLPKKKVRWELRSSKRNLERHGLFVKNFVLPFGAYNADIMALGMKRYTSLRPYELGSNPQGTLPWEVKVRSVTALTTPAMVAGWISEAKAEGRWLVIVYHRIAETGDDAYYTTPANLAAMLQVVDDSGIEVDTYDEGLRKFGGL